MTIFIALFIISIVIAPKIVFDVIDEVTKK
jgi:hypothetical protein